MKIEVHLKPITWSTSNKEIGEPHTTHLDYTHVK